MPHPRISHFVFPQNVASTSDTRLWAALQEASGGPWAGAVYYVDRIVRLLEAGRRALGDS